MIIIVNNNINNDNLLDFCEDYRGVRVVLHETMSSHSHPTRKRENEQ